MHSTCLHMVRITPEMPGNVCHHAFHATFHANSQCVECTGTREAGQIELRPDCWKKTADLISCSGAGRQLMDMRVGDSMLMLID